MKVQGFLKLPGDKSLTHRALLLAALARGQSRLLNPNSGEDVLSTVRCLQACGVSITRSNEEFLVEGGTLQNPAEYLDCGNSGTTARLLAGFLCGQRLDAVLVGDSSLSARPMYRVVSPLKLMGGSLRANEKKLPIKIASGPLKGIFYNLPVPSAQVKSSILFAGLGAEGETTVEDSFHTRDHTERMFQALDLPIKIWNQQVSVRGLGDAVDSFEYDLPGDFSTAAFFIALATIIPGSDLVLQDILLNETRLGFVDVLKLMGANIQILTEKQVLNELRGDIRVQGVDELHGFSIFAPEMVRLIDEIPLLALLGALAHGESRISGAKELRHKESDRLRSMAHNLKVLGANVAEKEDGLIIHGPTKLKSGLVSSFHDHRIAMTMLVAKIAMNQDIELDNPSCVQISCPEFISLIKSLSH